MVLADSDRIARVPSYLGTPLGLQLVFAYATITLFGAPFQALPLTIQGPTADPQPRGHLRDTRFRLFPGSLATTTGITRCFLFLRVLRCFTSPGSLLQPYEFRPEYRSYSPRWVSPFGHLRINVRLATPRSFSQPPTSFIASEHLGIHHTPLVAYLPLISRLHAQPPGGIVETRDQGPGPCSSRRTRKNHCLMLTPWKLRLSACLHAWELEVENFFDSAEIEFYPSYALFKERFPAT